MDRIDRSCTDKVGLAEIIANKENSAILRARGDRGFADSPEYASMAGMS
jgi:hypothetical protein